MSARVIVVGCGVSGLSCAVRLLEAGFRVEIWARDLPGRTVSAVAAALWYPLRHELDPQHGERWLRTSYDEFVALSADPGTGIVRRSGIELFRSPADASWWHGEPRFRRAARGELPPGSTDGFVWDALPVIDMSEYLAYLVRRFSSLGGRIVEREVRALDEPLAAADVVVNCSGLGARALAGDPSMVPIRGQIVRVGQVGIERFLLDEANPGGVTYIIPRSNDVVLGGTREVGAESLEPDPDTARAILERCVALEPRLEGAPIVAHRVGLRPGRPRIRLEAEDAAGKLVVHDYGHAGAGVTLSWGCAADVLSLAREWAGEPAGRLPS